MALPRWAWWALWKRGGVLVLVSGVGRRGRAGDGSVPRFFHRADSGAGVGWLMRLFNKVGRGVGCGVR